MDEYLAQWVVNVMAGYLLEDRLTDDLAEMVKRAEQKAQEQTNVQ